MKLLRKMLALWFHPDKYQGRYQDANTEEIDKINEIFRTLDKACNVLINLSDNNSKRWSWLLCQGSVVVSTRLTCVALSVVALLAITGMFHQTCFTYGNVCISYGIFAVALTAIAAIATGIATGIAWYRSGGVSPTNNPANGAAGSQQVPATSVQLTQQQAPILPLTWRALE
ncbi:hypothetical protein BIY23_03425 [Wolbachia pipientis]|uniref:J domain-containing protein n=1 Tax=Wolbachia pipientis TaxID=955 RepID=A0A1E7QJC6_WOLPI|nr:hypothetical protein [Wolbachia pipientis]OEY86582.1 hypothetical protein BIY23_03425 [Wolbachia pipientis]